MPRVWPGRRDEPEPGKQLVLAVDRHVPHAGRLDPLADRVVVLAAGVVELPALEWSSQCTPSQSRRDGGRKDVADAAAVYSAIEFGAWRHLSRPTLTWRRTDSPRSGAIRGCLIPIRLFSTIPVVF